MTQSKNLESSHKFFINQTQTQPQIRFGFAAGYCHQRPQKVISANGNRLIGSRVKPTDEGLDSHFVHADAPETGAT
jgi:hypothetical protein